MADSPPIGDIVRSINNDVKSLVRDEIELAKAELQPSAKEAGKGAGLLGGAGYLALNAMLLLYVAAALGIWALGVPIALAFVIVAVVLLIIAGILGLIGRNALQKVKPPERTIAQAQASVDDVKAAVNRAMAAAKAPQIEGRVEQRQLP